MIEQYKTRVLPVFDKQALLEAARLINGGETVAFPTETVYGLGADAMQSNAVGKIFAAKGRPSDNPLIVHVSSKEMMQALCLWNDSAEAVFNAFMPGPITVVLKSNGKIPDAVTAGGSTVGLRYPVHKGAQAFISACNTPIAAPSANLSGSPSPTTAQHVYNDLNGRIPLILDGGACAVGVESTVISLAEKPVLLRPGGITYEQLCACLGNVAIHPSILSNIKLDAVASPGMKYKHYAPKARVVLADGCAESVYNSALALGLKTRLFLQQDAVTEAKRLFAVLRQCDDDGIDIAVFEKPSASGMGLSVLNRLLRASAFTVISKGTSVTVSINGSYYTLEG